MQCVSGSKFRVTRDLCRTLRNHGIDSDFTYPRVFEDIRQGCGLLLSQFSTGSVAFFIVIFPNFLESLRGIGVNEVSVFIFLL
jgi:hypothetical protein